MRKFLHKNILLIGLIIWSTWAAQAQIYVSKTGNNTNDGSSGSPLLTINAAIAAAGENMTIYIGAGNYAENVVINKNGIRLIGAGSGTNGSSVPTAPNPANHTIITGGSAGKGIQISGAKTNIGVENIAITGYSEEGFFAPANSNNLTLKNLQVNGNCTGTTARGGIFIGGNISDVLIDGCAIQNNGPGATARAIGIWDNHKANITITNNYIVFISCCGIDLNDGTSAGVNISNNTVIAGSASGDSGIGVLGMKGGSGPNIIADNTITVAKRYGIEVKNPAGTGNDNESEDGAIIVRNNTISRTDNTPAVIGSETRDLAGIAVFRRSFTDGNPAGYLDVPAGVVIKENTISGFQQPETSADGFGIVAEGVKITIKDNDISACDIGIQRQAGNSSNYAKDDEGDADQTGTDDYFNRGNSPFSSAIIVSDNNITSTITPTRDVFAADSYINDSQYVFNTNLKTSFATIGLAIEYASAGNTLELAPNNTFNELVNIDKSLIIKGAGNTSSIIEYTSDVPVGELPTLFKVSAENVTIQDIGFKVNLNKVYTAIHSNGVNSDLKILNNHIVSSKSASGDAGGYGTRNAIVINKNTSAPGYTFINTGWAGLEIKDNIVEVTTAAQNGFENAFFRAAVDMDMVGNAIIDHNTFTSVNQDVSYRFGNQGKVWITNNTFHGGGVEISEMNAGADSTLLEGNTFTSTFGALSAPTTAQIRIKNNEADKAILVKNNIVEGKYWLASLENVKNVTLDGNTFTGADIDVATYPELTGINPKLVTINTKTIASSTVTNIDLGIKLISNTFNAGTATHATAIGFYNHKTPGNYGDLIIGESGKQNTFNNGFENFIYIDNNNGNLTKDISDVALTGYPEYGENIALSTTGYWTEDIRADENQFFIDGQLRQPDDLDATQRAELDTKIFDKKDDSNIGAVNYYFPVTNANTLVKYASIQAAIDAASAGDEINTLPGEYLENVDINKQSLKLIGPGASLATIKGLKINGGTTVTLSQSGAVLEGFTITRDGNNTTHWNSGLNNQGVSFNADNTTARNIIVSGNRNGVYINNRKNILIENSDITNNRTGMQLAHDVSGTVIRNNNITSNWTMGILYIDPSDPTGGLGQTTSLDIIKNNITGNWYSQLEFRTDNVNVLNFNGNYWGTADFASIDVKTDPSGEPGYNVQIPVAFGGSATPPASALIITGAHSDKVDFSVALPDYTDLQPAQPGYQPDSSIVWVYENSPVATQSPKLSSASKIVAQNGTIVIKNSNISSGGEINKAVTLTADDPTLTITGDLTVNTSTLDIAKATIIDGAFNLIAGKVTPASDLILNGTLSTTQDIGNFINGAVTVNNVSSNLVIPTGKGSKAAYIALTAASGTASSFTAEYFPEAYASTDADLSLASVSTNEYWTLTRNSGDLSAKVALYTFDLNSSGLQSVPTNEIAVAKFDTSGSLWESQGSDAGSSSFGIPTYVSSSAGLSTTYGDFTFASTATALPVELINFSAKATTEGALLQWTTASENGNDYFIIEKSTDGQVFVALENIPSKNGGSYQFTDKSFNQSAYYRLVQVDVNGKTTVYNKLIQYVKLEGIINVYPNPIFDVAYIKIPAGKVQRYELKVIDNKGHSIQNLSAKPGEILAIDFSKQVAGVYLIQIYSRDGAETHKLVKQ